MSDIDYSQYSYRDYKKGKRVQRVRSGKINYNFSNYEVYRSAMEEHNSVSTQDIPSAPPVSPAKPPEKVNTTDKKSSGEYIIEDLRSKKKSKMRRDGTGKKRNIKRELAAVMIVILCFSLTIVSADIFSGGELFEGVAAVFKTITDVPIYYAVDLGSYPDVTTAREAAELFRGQGAGGFLIRDGDYHIIAAVYKEKAEAETIVEKLINDGLSGSVYEIEGDDVNYNKFGEVGNELQIATDWCGELYVRMYQLSNSLDKEEMTENEAKITLSALYAEAVTVKETLVTKTLSYSSDENVLKVRSLIIACAAVLENLNNDALERPSLLADLRYSYTLVVVNYCETLKAL
jgi:hypothetical protein